MDICTLSALVIAGGMLGFNGDGDRDYDRLLATPRAYPANAVDDAHRPGFNGREYVTRHIIGPGHGPYRTAEKHPGESHYGGWGDGEAIGYARIGSQVVAFDPFQEHEFGRNTRMERTRQRWLKEHGYTGGVRTFTNDLDRLGKRVAEQATELPEPRGIFTIPADMPRGRSRQEVRADDRRDHKAVSNAVAIVKFAREPVRISWPHQAPAATVARTDATGGYLKVNQTELASK